MTADEKRIIQRVMKTYEREAEARRERFNRNTDRGKYMIVIAESRYEAVKALAEELGAIDQE